MMQATLSVIDFFRILYTICRNYPKVFQEITPGKQTELTCKRTNTFAVVYSRNQIEGDNLDKDVRYKQKDLFYSRYWEETNVHPSQIKFYYPALLVAEDQTVHNSPFQKGYGESVTFNFMMYDKMPDKNINQASTTPCTQRTFEEIGEELKTIMKNILFELSDFAYMTITTNTNVTTTDWYPQKWVNNLYSSGDIVSYDCHGELSAFLSKNVAGSKIFGAFSDDLAGYFCNVTVHITECQDSSFNYSDLTKEIIPVPDSSV